MMIYFFENFSYYYCVVFFIRCLVIYVSNYWLLVVELFVDQQLFVVYSWFWLRLEELFSCVVFKLLK